MKLHSLLILSLAFIAPILNAAEPTETKTLTVGENVQDSQSLTLNEGDRLEMVSAGFNELNLNNTDEIRLIVTGQGWSQAIPALEKDGERAARKIVFAGPLTLFIRKTAPAARQAFATFDIHRAGAPSNAVPIPQEAGANFNVILEQSSDLLNWTPANPGTYTGTEVKRFFRTRIVKITQ